MLIIYFGSVICLILSFFLFIKVVSKDDNRISVISFNLVLAYIKIIVFTAILLLIFQISVKYFVFSILNLYLTTTAYIDKITLNVYRFINYLFFLIAVILVLICKPDISSQIVGVLIYIVSVLILSFTGGYGKGDAFTLITIVPFILFLNLGKDFLFIMLINTVLYSVIFIFSNIKKINIKRMKLKSKSALTPSIATATILVVIIEGMI